MVDLEMIASQSGVRITQQKCYIMTELGKVNFVSVKALTFNRSKKLATFNILCRINVMTSLKKLTF
jgi:hypothetical protein